MTLICPNREHLQSNFNNLTRKKKGLYHCRIYINSYKTHICWYFNTAPTSVDKLGSHGQYLSPRSLEGHRVHSNYQCLNSDLLGRLRVRDQDPERGQTPHCRSARLLSSRSAEPVKGNVLSGAGHPPRLVAGGQNEVRKAN